MKSFRSICIFTLAAVALPHSVAAQNYTFTNIADTAGSFSAFAGVFGGPRLNNSGAVSFIAQLDAGGSGVYRGDGVAIATIADSSGPYFSFFTADINDAGQVAFLAQSDAIGPGIFRGDGVTVNTIILQRDLPFDSSKLLDEGEPVVINNAGVVAFFAIGGGLPNNGIYVGSGGNITPVSNFTHRAFAPTINNLGQVAYTYSPLSSTEQGIRVGNGGTTSFVIDNSGPYNVFFRPDLNDSNVVAVAATNDSGGVSVLRIDGGAVDVVAGPFTTASDVGINNAGDVAFMAQTSTNVYSILTGPDSVANKVIRDGDALFGSTATLLQGLTTIDGPNDAGQIVFRYSLADGRQGVALATPNAMLNGDFNCDGDVDGRDFLKWQRDTSVGNLADWQANYGMGIPLTSAATAAEATSPVPEPGSLILVVCSALLAPLAHRV